MFEFLLGVGVTLVVVVPCGLWLITKAYELGHKDCKSKNIQVRRVCMQCCKLIPEGFLQCPICHPNTCKVEMFTDE